MSPVPLLSDDQLTLRPLSQDDAPEVMAAVVDPEMQRFTSVPDADTYTEDMALAYTQEQARRWALTLTEDPTHRFAGSIELREGWELGYHTAPWARGRGLMVHAVRLVTDFAFNQGAEKVLLSAFTDNAASRAIAVKAGFIYTGITRASSPHPRRGDDLDLAVYVKES